MAAKSPNPTNSYGFSFVLKKPSILKHAVQALADPRFNETQLAVIQVGQGGFEITVQCIDSKTENKVFGFLCFKATGLQDFECNTNLRKTVSLSSLLEFLDSHGQNDEDSITVFVDRGSDKLSFQIGNQYLDVDLQNVNAEYETFPDVCYGFEAVIPRKSLSDTITELSQIEPKNRPADAFVTLKGTTAIIELDDELVVSTEDEPEKHEVHMDWQYWESLQNASRLAENWSMYLVKNPPEHIMFRFKLRELGDMQGRTWAWAGRAPAQGPIRDGSRAGLCGLKPQIFLQDK